MADGEILKHLLEIEREAKELDQGAMQEATSRIQRARATQAVQDRLFKATHGSQTPLLDVAEREADQRKMEAAGAAGGPVEAAPAPAV